MGLFPTAGGDVAAMQQSLRWRCLHCNHVHHGGASVCRLPLQSSHAARRIGIPLVSGVLQTLWNALALFQW